VSPAAADRGQPDDIPGPYSIGAAPDQWPGLSRLIEEAGEVLQVAGKIIGTGGAHTAYDGTPLRLALVMELGDLKAAIEYVIRVNELDPVAVNQRRDRKSSLYGRWHQAGREAAAQAARGGGDLS
jgi:hypothetical protein